MGGRDTRQSGRARYNSCGRKTRFRDEEHARKGGRRAGLRPYYCQHCRGWHLTSQPQRTPS